MNKSELEIITLNKMKKITQRPHHKNTKHHTTLSPQDNNRDLLEWKAPNKNYHIEPEVIQNTKTHSSVKTIMHHPGIAGMVGILPTKPPKDNQQNNNNNYNNNNNFSIDTS